MKIIHTYLIIILFFGTTLFGRYVKTADYVSSSNYLRLIQWNFSYSGTLPTSWSDIEMQHGKFPNLGEFPFRKRLGFMPNGIEIEFGGSKSRILVMDVNGQGEGRIIEEGRDEPGRLLVLFREPDSFEVIRIDEKSLDKLFQRAGYALADYTGVQGEWANKEELRIAWKASSTDGNSGRIQSDANQLPQSRPKQHSRKTEIVVNKNQDPQDLRDWIWISILAFVAVVSLAVTVNRRKRKP